MEAIEKRGIEPTAFYTLKELAELLNIHPATVTKWIRSGSLPAKKAGKKWFVAGYAIIKLLEPGTRS